MPEPNEKPTTPQLKQDICSIRIMFPVESDEEAIACKKKLKEVLSDNPNAQLHFTIMSSPSSGS